MYSLLHGFYKYIVQKDEFCVLILGLDNAGKTVKLIQYLSPYLTRNNSLYLYKNRLIWKLQKPN